MAWDYREALGDVRADRGLSKTRKALRIQNLKYVASKISSMWIKSSLPVSTPLKTLKSPRDHSPETLWNSYLENQGESLNLEVLHT